MSKVYKKNFLNQVILRVDFDALSLTIDKSYQTKLKSRFGDLEENDLITEKLELKAGAKPKQLEQQSKESVWIFSNLKTNTKLELSNTSLVLEYTSYKNSTILRDDLEFLFSTILEDHELKVANRVGLRYINQITVPTIRKIEDWKKFINPELLATPLYLQKGNSQTRFMNVNEFNNDSLVATGFRYGIWNEQYPSPITSSSYILDIDCFTRQPSDLLETPIESVVRKLNVFSEETFEMSITSSLRSLMGEL